MIRAAAIATFVLALASPALAQDKTTQEVGKSFYDVVKPDYLKDYCIFRN